MDYTKLIEQLRILAKTHDYIGNALLYNSADAIESLQRKVVEQELELANKREQLQQAKARILEAQPAQSVPSGFVLVPIEPTEEMRTEGMAVIDLNEDEVVYIYEAMLTAAPKPEAAEQNPPVGRFLLLRHFDGSENYSQVRDNVLGAFPLYRQPPSANAAQYELNRKLDAAAWIALNACLVPPDGGSPTPEEVALCEYAAREIRALKTAAPDGGA